MKKGFTLIELLAVITILAIIALIATPIMIGVINSTKEEANERSVEMYAKAVENAVAEAQLDGIVVSPGVYSIDKLPEGVEIKSEGDIECGTIGIGKSGNIYVADCKTGDTQIEYTSGEKMYKNGEEVYFDVTTGKTCTDYHEDNSLTGYNGIYEGENSTKTTDNQNGCLKFYVFNDINIDKVNLILDHNTTAKVAWTTANNADGPLELTNKLKTDTNAWVGTEIPDDYTYNIGYTIPYKTQEYKARIITTNEVAQITGNTTWKEEYKGLTGYNIGNLYAWLYNRTNNCTAHGCEVDDSLTYGYWTSHAVDGGSTFGIHSQGSLTFFDSEDSSSLGVRPVIEVLRSKLQ